MSDSIKIVENGFVFTADAQQRSDVFTILIRNDRISEISTRGEALKAMYPNAEVIDAAGKAIFPGFVDPHYHGESFILRPLTNRVPFSKWSKDPELTKAFAFVREHCSVEQLTTVYRLGFRAALKAGVTTLAEAGMDTLDRTFGAAIEAFSQSDLRGFLTLHSGDQVEHAKTQKAQAVRFLLSAPGEDDLTSYNLQTTARTAREARWPMVITVGETRKQLDILKKNFQKSPLQLLSEYKFLSQPVVLAHLVYFEPGDLEILIQSRLPALVSPASLVTKGTDIPPLVKFFDVGVPVALCGDWGLSDPFSNLRVLSALIRSEGTPNVQPFSLLESVTRVPAAVLGVANEVGSLEVGKKADLVAVDISRFQFSGFAEGTNSEELLWLVLNECSSSDIAEVMVNGEFYVRERTMLTYSEEDLSAEGTSLFTALVNAIGRGSQATSGGSIVGAAAASLVEGTLDSPAEEGFRIVKKGNEDAPATILQMPPQRPAELASGVKKIFGEEEEL